MPPTPCGNPSADALAYGSLRKPASDPNLSASPTSSYLLQSRPRALTHPKDKTVSDEVDRERNAAWTAIAALARNLLRWTEQLGSIERIVRAACSVRHRLLALPGRLVGHAGRWTLHLPVRWPWQQAFVEALERIRALPVAA